jgi:hypothetical protein
MHGDISQPENAVISKEDYELYERNRKLFTTALKGDLVSKTFLFIGFSFDDPNLSYILSRIRILLDKNQREHYCFFKKINEKDFECKEDFEYAKIKQQYKINDLKNYSIIGILINDYSEITYILKSIEDRFKRNSIFISGSASGYGDWGEDRCLEFIYYLGKTLAREEYKIVSGYGLGIGSQIINGALQHIFSSKYKHIDDYLVLRPFPIHITDKSKQIEIWHQYREDIIKQAGITIIILGNKKDDNGNLIEADGVYKEFEIAVKNGLKILPIGATGFVAEKLWHKINNDYDRYFSKNIKLRELFNKLNDKDIELPILIGNIIQMVDILKDEN